MSKKFLSALFSLCAPLRVLLCLFLFTGISSAAYTTGQFLTGGYAQNPFGSMAMGPGNVLYGAWKSNTDTSPGSFIKIATYSGSAWTELTSITNTDVLAAFSPLNRIGDWGPESMAVDSSGNIHVVFPVADSLGGSSGLRGIAYGKYTASSQTWALRKLFIVSHASGFRAVGNGEYALKLDSSQNPHVVFKWRQAGSPGSFARLHYAYFNGTTWNVTGNTNAEDGVVIDSLADNQEGVMFADIAFDSSNNLHLAYLRERADGSSRDIMYATKAAGGTTFTTPAMVMNAGNASRPSIVVEAGNKISIGDSFFSGMVTNFRVTTNATGNFISSTVGSYTVTTTGTSAACSPPILKVNASGLKVMTMGVWGVTSSNPQAGGNMRVAYETSPGTWAQEAMISNISDGYIQNPTMMLQPNNSVMVLYGKSLIASPFTRTLLFADGIPTGYGAPPNPNLTINDVTQAEGNAGTTSFTFTASLSAAAPAGGVTFNYATANNTATTANSDYTAATGTGTIAAGQTSTTITVLGNGDTTVEPDETFYVNLSAATNATITDAQGLGTITNDDTSIALTLPDSSLFEDQVSDFAFTFTRSGNVSGSATANFSYGGTAALTTDYTQSGATTFGSGNGTVTFGPGETSKIITINPVADNLVEGSETVGLSLNGGTGYNVTGTATQTATIVDDDVNVSVTVSPASVTEDGVSQLVYTFTRSGGPTSNPLVANVNVSGTATPNVDYASSGFTSFNSGTGEATVTFATGSATRVVTIYPSPDSTVEPDETVIVTLAANGTPAVTGGYTVGTPSTATGTILNDDTYVSVQSVSTTSVAENSGTNIVYTFSRTGPTTAALTANLEVQGSAKFPGDFTQSGATTFTATSGTITFAAGSSTTTVTLTLVDDEIVENNETINVNVTSGSGYAASGTSPNVTITDNDTATLTLAKINDGNEEGPVPALFRFSLSAPASTSVTIDYNFLGTASSGDYTSPGSSVTIAPGETSVDVSVPIVDDSTAEGTETLTLNAVSVLKSSLAITTTLPMFATADIIDNDKAVSIAAVTTSANEGTGAGTTPFTFTVSRNGPTIGAVSMTYTVSGSGGNPANAADFGGSFPTGTVTIPAGFASVPLTINVSRDSTRESNEDFTVTLSGPDNGYILSTATASATITNDDFEADLAITATDGVTTAVPGNSVTYTIIVSNAGPDPVIGATVLDTFPAPLTANWTAVGAAGGTVASSSGAGNINTTVNLPVGGSVTFTASATINASATGTLSNTATIAAPAGTTDLNPGNNSATDTDTLTPQANLSVTVTDGVTSATPGGSVTYTIVVSNAGPSNAPGATVSDTFPAALTATWTGVGAGGGTVTAAGSGNINDTVNLPAGGSVTYTVTANISPSATGTLVNTATVAAPAGVTDPTPGNNSATDTDTLTPSADLAITITDGVTTATPGGTVTYTITASNAGPSNASGATVACTFPAALTTTWIGATGDGTVIAAGSGNINGTVNLPAGGSVTYTVTASVSASASGTLSTTATVSAPAGVIDPTPGNNSATDTDTLAASADLAITVTDGVTSVQAGGSLTYTIVVSNAGPSNATGVTVANTFPAALTNVTWTGMGAGGGTATPSGVGNINDTINLPAGGSATYTVSASVSPSATGTLSNTATVSAPGGVTDPTPGNNSATDTDAIQSGTIGDRVWYDADSDGVQDAGEPGINGVTVELINASSVVVATTVTNADGSYSFTGLTAGLYEVRPVEASVPAGLNEPTTLDSRTVNLTTGQINLGVDFGYRGTGLVINFLYADYNGNGAWQQGEPGISNAQVQVTWAGQNGTFGDADDLTRTATVLVSDEELIQGAYVAYNAAPGNYRATVISSSLPAGVVPSYDLDGIGTPHTTAFNLAAGGMMSDTFFGYRVNDLSITATDGVTTALAGNQITYTITASNSAASPSTANGVIIEDTFAAALTDVSWTAITSGGASTASLSGTGDLNQTVNLPAGGSITYTVTATINGSFSGEITNTATLTAPIGFNDYIAGNNTATDSVTVSREADVSVTLTDSPDPVQANENVTYTVTLINNGPGIAQNPTVSMVIPAGMTFVSADQVIPGQGWGDDLATPPVGSGGTITITPGNFGVGQKAYTIVCKVGYVGNATVLSMTATASSVTTDPNSANNTATATTTVSAAPEIALHNGGSTIDAPITDGQPTAINFGTTTVNNPVTRSFTIANTGNDILSLTNIALPGGFSLVNPFSPPLQGFIFPGNSYTFQVRYDAATIGTASGDIVIANNDANESPFNFPITATRENVAPVAVTQDLTIEEDEVKAIVLTGNDADDQPITFAIVDQPQHGTLTGTAPNVTYTPNADYYGDDVFTFKVNDGTADSTEVEINLTITPVNDAPKVVSAGIPDQIQIKPDVPRTIDLTPYFSDAETASANLIYTVQAPAEAQAVVTGSSLVINGSVSGAYDITINAADSDTLNVSDTFTLTVKRVPQLAGNGVPPTLVSPSAPTFDLDLAGYFTDGDGDSLGYAITNNTDEGVLTATVNGSTVTITPVSPGVASLTVRVTDTDGNFIDHTFEITVDNPVPDAVPTVTSPPKLNRQTGLYEITLTATNNNQFNVPGFRFRVTSAMPSHIRLYNSTAPVGSSEPYLDVLNVLTPGQSITIVLEFHSTTRNFTGFDPTIIAEPLPEGTSNAATGEGMEINRFVNLPDGSKLIEFSSIAGRWYEIQYSSDLVTWKRSLVPVQAGANFTQWIDRGAPYTESHPSTVPQRFYRVSEILPD